MAEKYTEVDLLKMAIEAESFFTDSTKAAFRNIVNKVPTVDAVEVVRCKDCKHRAHESESGNSLCDLKMIGLVRANDFCSFGERREDNG